jgi:hypothetical protein
LNWIFSYFGGWLTRMKETSEVLYYHNMHEGSLCFTFPTLKSSVPSSCINEWSEKWSCEEGIASMKIETQFFQSRKRVVII